MPHVPHAYRQACGGRGALQGHGRHYTRAGRIIGSHTEFLDKAAEALSSARRLCDEGYLNVEITDTTTGEPCDKVSLERAARAEGH
jgi:hypothetical protein